MDTYRAEVPGDARIGQEEPGPLQGRASKTERDSLKAELLDLTSRTNSLRDQPGWYSLLAPTMTSEEGDQVEERLWTVLSSNFKQDFEGKEVKTSEPSRTAPGPRTGPGRSS